MFQIKISKKGSIFFSGFLGFFRKFFSGFPAKNLVVKKTCHFYLKKFFIGYPSIDNKKLSVMCKQTV